MPTPDPPDQRRPSDAMDIDPPKKRDADDMDIDQPKKRAADEMDSDQPRKRAADSLFVHEDEDNEDGHGSKRQKQDGDGLHASRPRDGTPSQDHSNLPGSQPQSDRSLQAPATLPDTGFDGNVPGLRQWKSIQRPAFAIFHPAFKRAQKGIPKACERFFVPFNILKDKGYVNEEIDRIAARMSKSRSPASKFPNIGPVVLLGPAGVGKSSALNCYLDKKAAAAVSDSTSRGTNTVHEYSAAYSDQTSEYHVVARYGPEDMIEDEIQKQCNEIYRYRDQDLNDLEAEDAQDLRARHDTAMNFFTTLLGSREEFDVTDEEPNYFDHRVGVGKDEVFAELLGFVKELLHAKGIIDNGMRLSRDAQNEDELDSIFVELSGNAVVSEKTGKAISTWPLMVKIEVHLEHDLLDCGLTIADAPGVTDTDQTVVRKTTNYLKGAGTILVYTTPDRIENNPHVDENLRACIELNKMHETYLVVTKIDGKDPLTRTEISALTADKRIEYQAAVDGVQTLQLKAGEVSKALKQLNRNDAVATMKALEQKMEIDAQLAQTKAKVKQLAIDSRNAKIKCSMKNKFRQLSRKPNAPDLEVIFTSSREYQKHLDGYDLTDPPMLDLQATGIPRVQDVLYSVLTLGRVNTLRRIIDALLPSAFSGIIGTLTHSKLERKTEVYDLIITLLQQEEARIVSQMVRDVTQRWLERIRDSMGPNSSQRNRAAESFVQRWSRYAPATFAAFCRREGVWKVRREGVMTMCNWNSEIQEIYAADLSAAFNALDQDLDNILDGFLNSINELYQLLERKLEACEAFQGANDKPFYDQIKLYKKRLSESVGKQFAKFRAQINSIRHRATLPTEHTCVIPIMKETYEKCAKMKGPGVHAARVQEIRSKLVSNGGGTGIFEAVYQEIFQRFQETMTTHEDEITDKLKCGSAEVLQDFDLRFQADEIKNEDDSEAKEILKHAAQLAQDELREVKRDLEEAVAYETSNGALA